MQYRHHHIKLAEPSKGFTITEVMISMALGMVLISSLFDFMFVGVQTYSSQTAVSGIQDEGRIVIDIMAAHIRMAGFQETDLSVGPLTDGLAGTEGVGAAADTITLKSQSGPIAEITAPLVDCQGNFYPGAVGSATEGVTTMTNTFSLVGNQLQCTNGLGSTVALGTNVEDFQVLYGVDTTSDGFPNQYLDADNATMTDAVAVAICLILRSDDNAVSVVPVYTNCAGNSVTPTDFRMRRTLQLVINLRNR
ncbi:MAG: PilW family protein [Proteobacteria bacterium]|nr:PilW family protein [Pseudomonadota bacterium]